MSTKYDPIGNTILVEAIAISTTIQIPGNIEADKYTIVALGDGDKIPKRLRVGDIVIVSGFTTPIKDTKYHICNADSVLCKVS